MVKRWLPIILMLALVLVVAGALWARAAHPQATGQPRVQAAAPGGHPTLASEHKRCTSTCNTVMPYYQKKYATLKTHDGDRRCWQSCWNRFGDKSKKNVAVNDMRKLWSSKNAQNLRANQCAQACYRKYHHEEAEITVAGYRSQPRAWVSAR